MSTIFSKIIKGEIPCYKIAEDDRYFAMLDINPIVEGHTLIIPKSEIDYLFDVDDDLLGGMMVFAKKIAVAIEKAVPCKRVGVAVLGLEVPHAHIHLLPINRESDISFTNKRVKLSDDQFIRLAGEIRNKNSITHTRLSGFFYVSFIKNSFRIRRRFLSLLFPRVCYSCGDHLVRNEKVICVACMLDMPFTGYHAERDNNLEKELWGRCYVEKAAAMCYYRRGSKMQKLVHRLKYNGIKEIGFYLGTYYGNLLVKSAFTRGIDFIIPVPLHPSRERKRGFNQSFIIARGISDVAGIEILSNVLVRKTRSSTQTSKSRVERWKNVEGIFESVGDGLLEGKHILLVDDVITTGSTIEACVNRLKQNCNVKVSVAALATAVQ